MQQTHENVHWIGREKGGNKVRSEGLFAEMIGIRLELPGNRLVGFGLICAVVAGGDCGYEVTSQGGIFVADFL